ncbi:cadherin domain-containing protein [Rhizobium sp. LjRoot254]|uniref:cadherin domain-containing protein n=1 Tax=Rhizobium sp. LjRoot254 TaxID=3342297 RepID=UPI003ECFBD79
MTTTTFTSENGTTVTIEYAELADETPAGTVLASVTVTSVGHTLADVYLSIPLNIVDQNGNYLEDLIAYSTDNGATSSSYNLGLYAAGATSFTFQLVSIAAIDFSDFDLGGDLDLSFDAGLDDSSIYDFFEAVDVPVEEDLNQAPVDLGISNAIVSEAARAGSVVGTLSATDPDGDAITWSLVAGQGDNDDFFSLKTNDDGTVSVVLKQPLNFEGNAAVNGVYDLVVKATDSAGNETTETINVQSTDELMLMAASPTGKNYVSVMENVDAGTEIGFFVNFDDRATPLTATLLDDADGMFEIKTRTVDGVTRYYLTTKGELDHETEDLHSVTVRATDANGNTQDKTYEVHVLDAAETGDTARGRITIDAATALAKSNGGVNWNTYIQAAYEKVTANLPNGVTFAPDTSSEYLYTYDDGDGLISLKGSDLAYWWTDPESGEDVHVVGGTVNSLAFGNNDNGEMTETELSITGLDLSNGSNLLDRIYGETNAMASAWMHGSDGNSPSEIEFVKALLSSYAQDFIGSGGKDSFTGTIFDDTADGGRDKDTLKGGEGADTIDGGQGADKLYGGADADIFVFAKGDTGKTKTEADTIYDFVVADGDTIDLSAIDANGRKANDQAFSFIGGQGFHDKAGELRVVKEKSDTWIQGDTNGDGRADFIIHLDDAMKLEAEHFDL